VQHLPAHRLRALEGVLGSAPFKKTWETYNHAWARPTAEHARRVTLVFDWQAEIPATFSLTIPATLPAHIRHTTQLTGPLRKMLNEARAAGIQARLEMEVQAEVVAHEVRAKETPQFSGQYKANHAEPGALSEPSLPIEKPIGQGNEVGQFDYSTFDLGTFE